MDAQPNPQFLCTSYVNDYPGGPLHITAIEEGKLRIVSVLYGTEVARLRLVGGATVDEVLATLKMIQHTATAFPIEQLEKIVWSDFSPDIVLTYHDGNKRKTARTCIASDQDKKQLLSVIGNSVTTPVKCSDELASVLSVAWSQFFGAIMTLVCLYAVVMMWDPVVIGRVRHGGLLLLVGRTGCAMIGVVVFLACCTSAWLAIRKRSRYFTCIFYNSRIV